jgi:hypothetical protein
MDTVLIHIFIRQSTTYGNYNLPAKERQQAATGGKR